MAAKEHQFDIFCKIRFARDENAVIQAQKRLILDMILKVFQRIRFKYRCKTLTFNLFK